MSTGKLPNTWGYWCKRRLYEQFEDENYHRTAVVASAGAFLGTYRVTKRPDHAIIVGGIVGVLFLLYEIHSVPSAPFEMARDKVDPKASAISSEEISNVTQIDKLQSLVSCRTMTTTALDACVIWNCDCSELFLYSQVVVEQGMRSWKQSFETSVQKAMEKESPKDPEAFKAKHLKEKHQIDLSQIKLEDVQQSPCQCRKKTSVKVVPNTIMRELIQLMKDKKWDEITPKIEQIFRFDKKTGKLENPVPVINEKGGTFMISEGEVIPEGYRVNDPLLALMKYINEGGTLASEEI